MASAPFLRKAHAAFFLLGIFFSGTAPSFSQSTCIDSVCFEESKIIAGEKIPLRGVALMEYLKFDLYTAAFYVPAEAAGAEAILSNIPKSLTLHYHRTVKKKWMSQVSRDRIKRNPRNNFKSLESRLRRMDDAYQQVEKNDRYEIIYVPGHGTSLLFNGKAQAVIAGEDFQRAFFGVWLSDLPVSKKLRDRLIQKN